MALFKVLRGSHSEGGKVYRANDPHNNVVDSKSNLLKHNHPGSTKFAKYEGDIPEPPAEKYTDQELEGLTVAELRQLAADEEIDLQGVTKKDDIILTILEAQSVA